MDVGKEFLSTPAEETGVWFQVGDARLLVACLTSKKYQAARERNLHPHRRLLVRGSELSQEAVDAAVRKAASEHLLLGWENVADGGKAVEYSPAAAEDMFAKYPKFLAHVLGLAADEAEFLRKSDDDGVAELKKGSPGT